ncbi:RNA polymerase sigma factor [Candidatus Gracilibacteria bacterium]|nr:RNA polymerase sigma factor [Candidatus Gracilibacteria bacterium]
MKRQDFTDEQLVGKSLEDIDFFGSLVERYEKRLLNYVFRISGFSPEIAEEILQEVFLKVWKNLNDFSAPMKFSSWIYRITHNETISTFRKMKSRGEPEQVELDENLFLPDKSDFVEEFDQEISSLAIKKVLAVLTEKYREVLVLRFFEDKSYEEISDILQVPSGTVATLIARSKNSFREASSRLNLNF